MGNYSPYAISQSKPPEWLPGEDMAAAAFVGMAFLVVVDINVGIWRVFKKRQGLYYWAMKLGTLGCFFDAMGVILKYLVPNSGHIWGLYTILLTGGWSVYALAQPLVLYSRLHLIYDNPKAIRWLFILIVSTIFWIIIPTWVVVWPAYNTDPRSSSLWSPRDAIVERYNQVGFTVVECVLGGIYIWNLLGLLNLKSSVRQRRVMFDLIYVNIIVLSFDFLVVLLVFLNRVGISHPIQTFSYALKLKLEFAVLNQLMAVAARGARKENFEERRYHHSSAAEAFSAECREWDKASDPAPNNDTRSQQQTSQDPDSTGSIQIAVPSPVLSTRHQSPSNTTRAPDGMRPKQRFSTKDVPEDEKSLNVEQGLELDSFLDDESVWDMQTDPMRHKPSEAFSGETLHVSDSKPKDQFPHRHSRKSINAKSKALHSLNNPIRQTVQKEESQASEQKKKTAFTGTIIRHRPKNGRDIDDEDAEEEIGVHMWENNKGKLVMEVPWFNPKDESA